MIKRIYLQEFFENQIVTRQAMSDFFNQINILPTTEFILDFSNICFISRSSADEYIKRKRNLNAKSITEENMSSEIKNMFLLAFNQYKKEIGLITA
jgi:hypothetical protein